jgi:hypothetical protein
MLSIILPVVISDFLEHLVDASLVQSSLFATSDMCRLSGKVTD